MSRFMKAMRRAVCLSLSAAILGGCGGLTGAAATAAAASSASASSSSSAALHTEVFQTSSAYDLGLDAANVRLGWRIVTDQRAVYQRAYNCVVADEHGAVAWDSGWVESSAQTGIVPENLKPETIYTARVNVKTQSGAESGFGEALTFETAPAALEGSWLAADRLLRYEFTLEQPLANVERARCYLASTGVIEIRLNGGKVGDLIWGPRKSVPDKLAYYNTYDITPQLRDGANCIGAYVSGNTYMSYDLCGMLRIRYTDGSVQTVSTGKGWKACATSEIVKENISKGEDIDLRKQTDWDTPGFKTGSGWKNAELVAFRAENGALRIPANAGTFTTYQTFSGNYTIEAELSVAQGVAAIEFGAKSGVSNPPMWQVGTGGLRLHYVGWTDIDTPSAKGLGVNKKVTLRIEIENGTVTTFVNGTQVHTTTKVTKSQTDGALAIRSAQDEIATYDRITVIQNGAVIWEDNFDTVDTDKWNFPGQPELVPAPAGTKVIRELKPVSSTPRESGGKTVWILDFGVNMQGYAKLTVTGEAGTKYKLEYAEMLDEDGDIWANTTAHKPVSNYTLSGGSDVFEPRFFYTGFRYLRVTPPDGIEFDPNCFTACFTSDDVAQTGFFESSNERLNKIFEMYNVSQRSNMMGNYTDCPQREKNGWTGDAAVTKESCAMLLADWATAEAYLEAMLLDVKRDGRPEIVVPQPSGSSSGAEYDITWASAIFIFPYELYMQTGDKYYIEHSIDTLQRVFDFARTYEKHNVVTHNVYGDWVGFDNGAGLLDRGFLSAACYYNCGMLLVRMLDIAGRDSSELAAHMEEVCEAIQLRYFSDTYYATPSQTCCSMALDFGLVPDKYRSAVLNTVKQVSEDKGRVLGTGVLGTKAIYDALSAANEHKLLLDMTVATEKCSFGFMLDHGATSLWEYWDTPGNNFNSHAGDFLAFFDSLNHVMLGGGPACWMFQGLAGIRATGAGYSALTYRPGLESGLTHARASIDSVIGTCVSDWSYVDGKLTWTLQVPANATATVVIPVSGAKSIRESGNNIFERDGDGIKYEGRGEGGEFIYTFGGGTYLLEVSHNADGTPNSSKALKIALGVTAAAAVGAAGAAAVIVAKHNKKKQRPAQSE